MAAEDVRRAAALVGDALNAIHSAAIDAERAAATYQEIASVPATLVPEMSAAVLRPYVDRLAAATEHLRAMLTPAPEPGRTRR